MRGSGLGMAGFGFAALLIAMLMLPLVALLLSSDPAGFSAGIAHPMFGPALVLSVCTTVLSLLLSVLLGTPLAWWLARSGAPAARVLEVCVDLPIVVPPAVVGVGLLQAFGRQGLFGAALDAAGIAIPFSTSAVILAQVVVASPFYVQAAVNAFRKVEADTLTVARSLGASSTETFLRVALPIARPGLISGASLCWARCLGEFGATLLFAGNMPGRTQTMPLAIFSALESDVRLAVVFALVLAAVGAVALLGLRYTATAGWATSRSAG